MQRISGISNLADDSSFQLFNQYKKYWSDVEDSINYSYAYFLITARKGGWIYCNQNTIIVLCWHPNVESQVLIYPPLGENPHILTDFLSRISAPSGGIRLARFNNKHLDDGVLERLKSVAEFQVVEEDVLDWKYPSPVLSTDKVIDKTGKDLHLVRKELRKLDLVQAETRLYTKTYYDRLVDVARIYAGLFIDQNKDFSLSENQIVQSNIDMLNLALENPHLMSAYVTIYKGQPEGFYVIENFLDNHANAIWFLYNRNIRGLAYWQMTRACEILKKKGVKTINIGGSETKGMDFFKTRFRPVQSFPCFSIDVQLKPGVALESQAA